MSDLPFNFAFADGSKSAWGPPSAVPESLRFNNIPYAPYSKSDKLGKAADWLQDTKEQTVTTKNQRPRGRDQYHAYGASVATSFGVEEDEPDFSVVDNKAQAPSTTAVQKPTATILRGKKTSRGKPGSMAFKLGNPAPKSTGNKNYPSRYYNKDETKQKKRDASIKVEADWKMVADVEFSKLTKLNLDVSSGEIIDSYGSVPQYNKKFESGKGSHPLELTDRTHFNPTASEDPVFAQLSSKARVFATDAVLAQIMCASRSVYSWDVVITKKNDSIYLDKREGSILDRVTVDENAPVPPADIVDSEINTAESLALEATYINENFLKGCISEGAPKLKFGHPESPFAEMKAEQPLSNRGYRYKKFDMPSADETAEPMSILVRSEVDSISRQSNGSNVLLSIGALNQYVPGDIDWKTKLDHNRGTIIAAELKKNNNKVSKWSCKAILAGCDQLKIGFVARTNPKINTKHEVLGVATYRPHDLISQINLSIGNGWGIVRSIIDIVDHASVGEAETKFVVLKDPNFAKISIYKIPVDALSD